MSQEQAGAGLAALEKELIGDFTDDFGFKRKPEKDKQVLYMLKQIRQRPLNDLMASIKADLQNTVIT